MGNVEARGPKTTVTEKDVNELVAQEYYQKLGRKTTVCLLTLVNGFEVAATVSCVDPMKFDLGVGKKLAKDKALAKVWELACFAYG